MNIIFIIIVLIIIFWVSNDLLKIFEHAYTGTCVIDGTWGNFYDNKCYPAGDSNALSSTDPVSSSEESGDTSGISGSGDGEDSDSSGDGDGANTDTDYSNASVCFPDNSNFGEICRLRHGSSEYGVKDFDTSGCESGTKKVECGQFYYNKVDYNDKDISSTPCLERSIDFDEACRYYQPIRPTLGDRGYNVNSVGVKQKLYAQDGDCYHRDGTPDLTRARGLCNLNYLENVTKLDHFPDNYNYNVFTDCNKISTNFNSECATKLSTNNQDVYAYVSGYDCNPGYARAKCINKKDNVNIPENIKKFMEDSKSDYLGFQNIVNDNTNTN